MGVDKKLLSSVLKNPSCKKSIVESRYGSNHVHHCT